MSERSLGRNYSPAARALLDAFCSWQRNPERRAELERRGLVPTNNLGLYMSALSQGPDSTHYQLYYQYLPDRAKALLERCQATNPELWNSAVEAHLLTQQAAKQYSQKLVTEGAGIDPTSFAELSWARDELLTQVFDTFANLEPEEAFELCR